MKNFKLYRTGSLVLGLWLLASSLYVILQRFEPINLCSTEPTKYGLYPFIKFWLEKDIIYGVVKCDMRNLSESYWIIPIDLIVGALFFLGVFGWLQFKKK